MESDFFKKQFDFPACIIQMERDRSALKEVQDHPGGVEVTAPDKLLVSLDEFIPFQFQRQFHIEASSRKSSS